MAISILKGISPTARKGVALVLVITVVILGLAFKNQIKVATRGGESIQAEFAQGYGLIGGVTKVKIAGLQVGVVTDVDYTDAGTALVSMKVDDEALDAIGSTPTARVVPLTLLGGQYAVELHRGGNGEYDGSKIDVARTSMPVELDRVLEALPADTRKATQRLLGNTDKTLKKGGTENLRGLLDVAPAVLPPAGTLLESLQGENPGNDLPSIVTDLQDMADVLVARDQQVSAMLSDLDTTTSVLAARRGELAGMIDQLPEALDSADRGLAQLNGTLELLDVSTDKLKPSVKQLAPLLDELRPTIAEARPVLAKLPPITSGAREVLKQLVPSVSTATQIVNNLRGPVIDRVNGPILTKLGNTWHGENEFKHSGGGVQADNKFYEEIAYMVTNLNRSVMSKDSQGSVLHFQAGAGLSSIQPLALDEQLSALIPQLKGMQD